MNGNPEGGTDSISIALTNSTAVGTIAYTTATTVAGTAAPIIIPTSGRFCVIVPPATNTQTMRLAGSTAEVGVPISSNGAHLLSVRGGTTFNIYTTESTTIPNIRVIVY